MANPALAQESREKGTVTEMKSLSGQFDQALQRGDYDTARRLGEVFVEENPKSATAPRVEYWLGTLETDSRRATRRLKSVIKEADRTSQWSTYAERRMAELALLEGDTKEALSLLRSTMKREAERETAASRPLLDALRLDLAGLYLNQRKERSAAELLDEIVEPGRFTSVQEGRYQFLRSVILWRTGKREAFWQGMIRFEDRFRHSSYLPAHLALASGLIDRRDGRSEEEDSELWQELVEYYPTSPEAYLARQALRAR